MILRGELAPGEKLSLRKLAARVESSVTPVIEALNLLAADGLVESRPHWGYFISLPTREQIADHLVMREAIECQIARRLNEGLGPQRGRSLRKSAAHLDKLVAGFAKTSRDAAEIEQAHCDFHLEMARLAESPLLEDALRRINLQFLLIKADSAGMRHEVPAHWHAQLVDDILGGSPTEADEAMRRHVRHSAPVILSQLPAPSSQKFSTTTRQ